VTSLIEGLKQQIFGNLYAFFKDHTVRKQIKALQTRELPFETESDADLAMTLTELEVYCESEDERRKAIDDKAKSSLTIITLSVTIILAGFGFMKDGASIAGTWVITPLILSLIYFVLSAITSVVALTPTAFFVDSLDDRIKLDAGKYKIIKVEPDVRIPAIYNRIRLNQLALMIRSNYVSATWTGIRNGIILLAAAYMMAALGGGVVVKPDSKPEVPANCVCPK
jgi:hypothetical protein